MFDKRVLWSVQACRVRAPKFAEYGSANKQGLPELLRGFMHHWALILRLWSQDSSTRWAFYHRL